MDKIKNIEFLRIIGCIAIVLLHLFSNTGLQQVFTDIPFYNTMQGITRKGFLAVDLFFIISGFFFAFKLDTTKTLYVFLKKKIIRLYPVFIFLLFSSWLIHITGLYKFNFYQGVINLFCLNGTSLVLSAGSRPELHVFWYISTMLWTLMLYYYLVKNFEKKTSNLIIGILTYLAYALMVGHSWVTMERTAVMFNGAILRGIGGIGIGYFIGQWYVTNINTIKTVSLNVWGKLLLTIIEFMCLFFIINNLMLHKPKFTNKILFILVFTITIVLFLIKQGYISKLLDKINWFTISKYTYSIYLVHFLTIEIIKNAFWVKYPQIVHKYPIFNIIFSFLLVILLGVLIYYLVEEPCARYFKNKKSKTLDTVGGGKPYKSI